MAKRKNAAQEAASLWQRLQQGAGNLIQQAQPGNNGVVQQISNIRLRQNAPTLGQAFQGAVRNSFNFQPKTNQFAPLPFLAGKTNFNLSQPAMDRVKSPVGKFITGAGLSIAEQSANIPSRLRTGIEYTNNAFRSGNIRQPSVAIGAAAKIASPILDLATLGGGTVAKGVAVNVGKQAFKQTFKQALKKGALQGAGYGAGFGLLSGLSEGQKAELQKAAEGLVFGGIFGGTIGAGAGGVGHAIGKVFESVMRADPGISKQEATKRTFTWIRDKYTGRYTGMVKNDKAFIAAGRDYATAKTEPKVTDWRDRVNQDLGLGEINPQGGFLKLSEFLPTKTGNVQTTQASPTKSVIEDIKGGFAKGRVAREQVDKITKGSLSQRARTEFVDRLTPVYDLVNQAAKDLPAERNPYKQMRLLAGTSGKVEAFASEKVAPILKGEQQRIDDLSALWALQRESELVERGLARKRNAGQIEQGILELKQKYGEEGFRTLQESSEKLKDVGNEMLDMLLDAGIIDQESFNTIRQKNQFYAPMEAVDHMSDQLEKFGTGSFNVSSQDVIKRIGDYRGDVADPIETLVRRIPKVLGIVEKNKALQSLANLRNEFPDTYKDLIFPVKGDSVPQGMGAFNVFENGKNIKYAVPDVVEAAIKNLDAETAGILVKLGSIQAKWLRAGATGLNIGFIPVNIVRDVQDSLTTEISENGVKAMLSFLASYPRAIYSAAGKGELYQQWAASGGLQSTMTEQIFKTTPKTVAELSGKRAPLRQTLNPLNAGKQLIEFANRVGEQSTRLARFNSGLARGESAAEAAFKSRDISLDFAKAGNSIKVLNQVIPFLNAGIQGSEKMLRLYKNNPKAAIAATGVLFGIPTIALFTHNSQFKDYDDIPEGEKQTNWIILARDRTPEEIANGDGPVGVKIPKGFLPRIITNGIESSMQFMKSKDPSTFLNTAIDTAAGISPIGLPISEQRLGQTLSTILPPWIKAGVEWTSNTNTFFGSRIVPQGLENLPAGEQYRENTPGIYKLGGKLSGLSPLKLENTVNTTLGGLGRQIANLTSLDVTGGTVGQISRRFMDIRGGKQADESWKLVDKEKEYTALRNKQIKEAFKNNNQEEFSRLIQGMDTAQVKRLILNLEKADAKKELSPNQRALETLTKEERARLGNERPELRSDLDLIEQAGAAEISIQDFSGSNTQSDLRESNIKKEVKQTGKIVEENDKIYYPMGNSVRVIDFKAKLEDPTFTGQTELDKKALSDYSSQITKKKNEISDLIKLKKLTPEEGEDLLRKLNQKLSAAKTKLKPQESFELTGDAVIDKKIKTRFQTQITNQINEVVDYVQKGELTVEEGRDLINRLNAKRGKLSGGGGGKKAKKVNYKGVKVPKVNYNAGKTIRVKIPKTRIPKYKPVKPLKIRKIKVK